MDSVAKISQFSGIHKLYYIKCCLRLKALTFQCLCKEVVEVLHSVVSLADLITKEKQIRILSMSACETSLIRRSIVLFIFNIHCFCHCSWAGFTTY